MLAYPKTRVLLINSTSEVTSGEEFYSYRSITPVKDVFQSNKPLKTSTMRLKDNEIPARKSDLSSSATIQLKTPENEKVVS